MNDGNLIAPEAVVHPGCRIENSTLGPGCEIGAQGPVVLENCRLGRGVKLHGGYFNGAVFLDGANMGPGAHVRAGTVLEEQAGGAHTVGLKQTVLLPFVTLGSLINFCDILMAGGTSRKNHSEVGSSYIHFNFTPNQDKATPSLVGDVPRGVLLREKPVFLGGQGGLVGPSRIAFGTVIAAGGICRRDILEEGRLHVPAAPPEKTIPFESGRYGNIGRIVHNNLVYIGNIRALKAWYQHIRVRFIRDEFDQAVYDGALVNLDLILNERFQRLEKLIGQAESASNPLSEGWIDHTDTVAGSGLMDEIEDADKSDYLAAIKHLSEPARAAAVEWLRSIVDLTAEKNRMDPM